MNPWGFTVVLLGLVLVIVGWSNAMGSVFYMVTGKKPQASSSSKGSGSQPPAPFNLNPFGWIDFKNPWKL